jgi:ABC-type transport system involved in cytochrome bd biosynthesis fused ATPase/permease subunit
VIFFVGLLKFIATNIEIRSIQSVRLILLTYVNTIIVGSWSKVDVDKELKKYTSEIDNVLANFINPLFGTIKSLSAIIVMLIVFAFININVSMYVLLLGLTYLIFHFVFIRRIQQKYGRDSFNLNAVRFRKISDYLRSINILKLMNKERYFFSDIKETVNEFSRISYQTQVLAVAPKIVIEFLLLAIIAIFIFFTQGNNTDVDTTLILLLGIIRLTPIVNNMMVSVSKLAYGISIYDEITKLSDYTSSEKTSLVVEPLAKDINEISIEDVELKVDNFTMTVGNICLKKTFLI